LEPGFQNIVKQSLIDSKDVLLSFLHIKLGLMKQFIKALSAEDKCFQYLRKKFPSLSKDKIKKGVFVGPDIKKLMKND